MDRLNLKTPAKINLFLHVIGRRGDGHHNILTIFQKIGLWDRILLSLSKGAREINLICPDSDLPAGEDNLAFKAAKSFLDRTGIECVINIKLEKSIPVGAGLGGGSSDAAAVLKGLNILHNRILCHNELHDIACRLGADVPFFISGSNTAVGRETGTNLEAIDTPCHHYVLVWPGFSISTKWVYERFELTSKLHDTIFDASQFLNTRLWINDLERAVIPQYPQIGDIKNRLMALGAETALMSGSGSTVFGVFSSRHKAESAETGLGLNGVQRAYLVEGLKNI